MVSVLAKLGRRDEGIEALKLLIKKYPKFTGGYLNLAFQLGEAGRYDEAIKVSDKALETIEKAKRNEDLTYNAHKKVKVEDNNGEIPVIYNNRGYAKYKLGLHDEALKDINTSIDMLPDNSYAYRNRALVYLAINKKDLACEDISKSISLNFTKSYGPEMEQLKQQQCK
jgi:tetratricopeptide (TPR) repeat protein